MTRSRTRRDEGSKQRTSLYTWFLIMVVAAGVAASVSTSYMLYRMAQRQWIARAEADAQRFSSMLLDWVDESYAPLSGLAALVETSRKPEAREFLNAFAGSESRSTTGLLGAAGMLERDVAGRWTLAISSGNFQPLESDAAAGFPGLEPLIELANARPNQFVLGPPINEADGRLVSPVLLALTRVKVPT